jgi:hypothetical protein
MTINFLSAWFGVSLLCWLWLWIMAHAVSAAEALRQQHLQQTTRRGVGRVIGSLRPKRGRSSTRLRGDDEEKDDAAEIERHERE